MKHQNDVVVGDQVSPITFLLSKEQIKKDNERDQNTDKIMTSLDILYKYVMGACTHSINFVAIGSTNPNDIKFEALYSEGVNFLVNQSVVY